MVLAQQENNFILASASPRRRQILNEIGLPFTVIASDADEIIPKGLEPKIAVQLLAAKKASSVAKSQESSIVIGADTIVLSDGRVLGKPSSEEKAAEMLRSLSGKTHEVITGVSIIRTDDGKMFSFADITKVEFYEIKDDEIQDYIKTGEPMDKAGAYAIQGIGRKFVKNIIGDYYNVVGLPKKSLIKVLRKEFGVNIDV